jgi:hypothetical protein
MPTFQQVLFRSEEEEKEKNRGPGARARRFYGPNPRGVNVYVYGDGTVTTEQPIHTTTELTTDVVPVTTYYGGHVYLVTAAEAAVLNAAGYTTS